MATVVNLVKDTRAAELGAGISGFLDRMKDKRLDGLQQEMMGAITAAGDEITASAIFSDPKFRDVVGIPDRLSAITTHYNNAPLGKKELIAYDKDGVQRIVVMSETEDPAKVLKDRGLFLERSRPFIAFDPNDPFDDAIFLGRNVNAVEARSKLSLEDTGKQVFDQEEADLVRIFTDMRDKASGMQISKARLTLAQIMGKHERDKPLTIFDALIRANKEGLIPDELYDSAWKKINHLGFGRVALDVAEETSNPLIERGAAFGAFAVQATLLMEAVFDNPDIISGVGGVDRFFENIGAELTATASLLGYTRGPIEDYRFGNFASKSTAFKNMLTSIALVYGAIKGQDGKHLSDKDFAKFLVIVGDDISNPAAFITNLQSLLDFEAAGFQDTYARLQTTNPSGPVANYEREFGAFARFDPTKKVLDEKWLDETEKAWGVVFERRRKLLEDKELREQEKN